MLITHIAILSLATIATASELTVLLVGYPSALSGYVQQDFVPAFEAQQKTKVNVLSTDWDGRMDKILVLMAGGTPADVVVTGFYSPYEEGSLGLLEPLDKYLAQWKHTAKFPAPLWDSQKWQGRVMAVPQNIDFRGIGYNKELFSESGLDPNRTPNSWDELRSFTKRLTRLEGDRVAVRGMSLNRGTSGGAAQDLFWFMRQAGLAEINLTDFTSNLNHPDALTALQFMVDLQEAAQGAMPSLSGGFSRGRIAMQRCAPNTIASLQKSNPDMLKEQFGLFPPRRSPDSEPVAHAFINGLAITSASRNKDLAWEFIAALMDDERLYDVQRIAGWIAGRPDLARRMMEVQPRVELWYEMFAYLQASTIPPPRNTAQQEVAALLRKVYNMELAPKTALEQAHPIWNRLLGEWKTTFK